jgi:hypothetical protein
MSTTDIKGNNPQPFSFQSYSRYTTTFIAAMNWTIDHILLFEHISIPELKNNPFSSKKNELLFPVPNGTVLRVKYKDITKKVHVRGYLPLGKEDEGCFRNSTTVVMFIDKVIVMKIPPTGKIQIAGCRNEDQVYKSVHAIWKHIQKIAKTHPGVIKIPERETPKIIFNPVMNNLSISIGFNINKKKIHEFLYRETEFFVIPNDAKYAGITAKLKVDNLKQLPMVMNRFINNRWYKSLVTWNDYLSILHPKDRVKEDKAIRYHTFLIFHSGRIIQSSPRYELMEQVYNMFTGSNRRIN